MLNALAFLLHSTRPAARQTLPAPLQTTRTDGERAKERKRAREGDSMDQGLPSGVL